MKEGKAWHLGRQLDSLTKVVTWPASWTASLNCIPVSWGWKLPPPRQHQNSQGLQPEAPRTEADQLLRKHLTSCLLTSRASAAVQWRSVQTKERSCVQLLGVFAKNIKKETSAYTIFFFLFFLWMVQKGIKQISVNSATRSWTPAFNNSSVLVTFILALRHFKHCWFILPWIWMKVVLKSQVVSALQMGFHGLSANLLREPSPSSVPDLFRLQFLLVFLILK